MSHEIQLAYPTGATLYAVVLRPADGQICLPGTLAFEAITDAHWSTYVIAMTEQGTASGLYEGSFPAIGAGTYAVIVYLRAGGSPAISDHSLGSGRIEWSGSAEVPLSNLATAAAVASVPGAVWEDLLSSGHFDTAGSIGALFLAGLSVPLDTGFAQAGTSDTITLRSGAPGYSLVGCTVAIDQGTGAGQAPTITAFDTTTKVATVAPAWLDASQIPDTTSVYSVWGPSGAGGSGGDPWAIDIAVAGYTGTQAGKVLRVIAAEAAGELVQSTDGSTTTIKDAFDPTTTLITSTNTGTTRTTTIH